MSAKLIELLDLINVDPRINDLGNAKWPAVIKVQAINSKYFWLANYLMDVGSVYFTSSHTFTPASGGNALPADFARIRGIDGVDSRHDFVIDKRPSFDPGINIGMYENRPRVCVVGNRVYLPTGITGQIELIYYRRPPKLHRGMILPGATSTSIQFNSVPMLGKIETVNDYYLNATIVTSDGTGAGQSVLCSAYAGSTRTATVAAMSPVADSTTVYEIANELPDIVDFDNILVELAIYHLLKKPMPDHLREEIDMAISNANSTNYSTAWERE